MLAVRGDEVAQPDPALGAVSEDDRALAAGKCDGDDEHVLAAVRIVRDDPGLWEGTDVVLVTDNIRHFDVQAGAAHELEILRRDDFGQRLLASRSAAIVRVVDREPESRYRGMLDRMRRDQMYRTVALIEDFFDQLDR